MPGNSSSALAEILRETIRSVEQCTDIHPDHLLELKRMLLRRMAVLETADALPNSAVIAADPPLQRLD